MNKNLPIVIVGPTSSGKTAVACALARIFAGEIISADSRQVYKYLDVGTNKAGVWDKRSCTRLVEEIPQHLTDVADPSETFSAGSFVSLAKTIADNLSINKKLPIIVGGTGLYISALIDGLSDLPPGNDDIRKELKDILEKKGIDHLYEKLKKIDPETAEKNKSNPQRLVRALELCQITNKPVSQLYKETKRETFPSILFGLKWDREDLYDVIDKRSALMIESGMIEETETLLKKGYNRTCPGFQGIGYREVVSYIDGNITKEQLLQKLQQDTRNYAKRQETWFRRDKRIIWIEAGPQTAPDIIARKISQQYLNLI